MLTPFAEGNAQLEVGDGAFSPEDPALSFPPWLHCTCLDLDGALSKPGFPAVRICRPRCN